MNRRKIESASRDVAATTTTRRTSAHAGRPPQDVIDRIKAAATLSQYQVTNGRKFVDRILKTNQLIFQENATLYLECGGYKDVVILADELIFQRNYGPGEDRCGVRPDIEHGFPKVDGQDGEDGSNGREFHDELGRDGWNAGNGGDGSDGITVVMPTVYFIAFSIKNLSIPSPDLIGFSLNFDGFRGGNGGNGGRGGRGGMGEQGQHSTSGSFDCQSGPGWGGRGGNGGNGGDGGNGASGGNGADIYVGGSKAFLDAETAFHISNGPGSPGQKGIGGRHGDRGLGGNAGAVSGWCSPAPRIGQPGKVGRKDGQDGIDSTKAGSNGSLLIALLKRRDFFP